ALLVRCSVYHAVRSSRFSSSVLLRCYAVHHSLFFFFNYPPTTEIYTLSLHDALPIWDNMPARHPSWTASPGHGDASGRLPRALRSEEHTSELQSRVDLVCRLLLEKKKYNTTAPQNSYSNRHANPQSHAYRETYTRNDQ